MRISKRLGLAFSTSVTAMACNVVDVPWHVTPAGGGRPCASGCGNTGGERGRALLFTSLETSTGARTLRSFSNGTLSTLSSSRPAAEPDSLPHEPFTYESFWWNDRSLLSASPDGTWVVWDTGAGVEAVQPRTGLKVALEGVHLPVDGWAPDGKAFTFLRPSAAGYAQYELHLVSLPSGRVSKLAEQVDPGLVGRDAPGKLTASASVWSPDGSRIAYRVWAGASDGSAELHTVLPDGSDTRLIASSVAACIHVWSADGKWLAYLQRNPLDSGLPRGVIATARPDGSEQRVVHTLANGHGFCSVAPVGAAWVSVSEPSALTVLLADGTGARRLGQFQPLGFEPSMPGFDPIASIDTPLVEWSPDAQRLAAGSLLPSHPFFTIQRDGGNLQTQYGVGPNLPAFTFWSPNSRHFITAETLGDAQTGTGVPFARKPFQFSPEGSRMVFVDGAAFVMRPDATEKILLAEPSPPVDVCHELEPGVTVPPEYLCEDGRMRVGSRFPRFTAGFLESEDQVVILSGDRLDEYRLRSGTPQRRAIWTPGATETLTAAVLPSKLQLE